MACHHVLKIIPLSENRQDAQEIKQKGKHKTGRQRAFTRTNYVRHRKSTFAQGPWKFKQSLNPLTPMSDQDRISPYDIPTISIRQTIRIKKCIS